MKKFIFLAAIVGTLGYLAPAQLKAQELVPVEQFASLPFAQDIKLSPNGEFYAALSVMDGERRLFIIPTDGTTNGVRIVGYGKYRPGFFEWAGDQHVIMAISFPFRRYGVKTTETRMVVIDIESGDLDNLIHYPKQNPKAKKKHYSQIQSRVVSFLPDDDKHVLIALDETEALKPDVMRVNLRTRSRARVHRYRSGVSQWLADASGTVRMGWGYRLSTRGYQKDEMRMIFRATGDEDFKELGIYDAEGEEVYVESLTEDPHIIMISKDNEHGRDSLYLFDTRTMEIVDTVFSHEKYDYLSFSKVPQSDKIASVSYIADDIVTVYLDEATEQEADMLQRSLPGFNNRVVSRSKNGKRIVIRSEKTDEPTRFFYFDLEKKTGVILASTYEALEGISGSVPQPIRYKARDGLPIEGYLTVPKGADARNLPLIVHPHGGPHSRDTMRYDYWVQYFASRGWAVLQMNFRGSSGYGTIFQRLGRKNWGLAMQDDITDGVQWAIDNGIADPDRICIVGASYGGYAAIQATVKTPDLYRCAVGLNGVYDTKARLDQARYYSSFLRHREYLRFDNAKEISPEKNAEKINVPVMIAYGEDDRTVDQNQSKGMISALKKKKKRLCCRQAQGR